MLKSLKGFLFLLNVIFIFGTELIIYALFNDYLLLFELSLFQN